MSFKKNLALFLITSVVLMVVALYNGFPLVENDTTAYIEQAIYPHFTPDRTPFYGMFVRISCLWTSLWFTVFAQCLVLAFLLLRFIQQLGNSNFQVPDSVTKESDVSTGHDFSFVLIAVIAIVSFTCVSWVVSYLVPDIFGGILLLATILFLAADKSNPRSLIVYAMLIFAAMLMHNSHFLILLLFSLILLVYALVKKQKLLMKRCAMLLALCVAVWGLMCSMNAIKKHGFVFSRGRDIMLTAKFAETGILNTYLSDNCGKKQLQICNYKDHIPGNITEFLTSGDGPVYKMGGWDSSQAAYHTIVHDVFTTPKYLAMFVQKSATGTLKQLAQVQAPDKVNVWGKDSEPWGKVKQYFADELPTYTTSLQNSNALSAGSCNFVYYLFLVLSSLWMLLYYQKVMTKELVFIYGCIILFLVVNAFVTASLSAVTYRFQYRVSWLLPATNAVVILKYYYSKFQDQKLMS